VEEALEGALGAEASGQDDIWAEAIGALSERLRATTIAEISEREARQGGAQMYYI